MTKKVVLTDYDFLSIEKERDIIERAGFKFLAYNEANEDRLTDILKDADAVLNQYSLITHRIIEAMQKCKIIVRYGVGVDGIDIAAATANGIVVANVPDYGTNDVADHAISLMLACHKGILQLNTAVHRHTWNYHLVEPLHRLKASTLGIIGCGRIGRNVASKMRHFVSKVIGCDPYVDPGLTQEVGIELTTFKEVLAQSDILTLHVPLTDETRGMIGSKELNRMKPNAVLVNTARGGVVDENALYFHLRDRKIRMAALDVCYQEPLPQDSALKTLDNLLLTPHCAWYSEEAIDDLQRRVAEEAVRVLEGKPPLNPVNPEVVNELAYGERNC